MIKTNVISNRFNNLAVNTSNRIETRYLTSSVLAESTGDLSLNIGYNFSQVFETYSISAAHGFLVVSFSIRKL